MTIDSNKPISNINDILNTEISISSDEKSSLSNKHITIKDVIDCNSGHLKFGNKLLLFIKKGVWLNSKTVLNILENFDNLNKLNGIINLAKNALPEGVEVSKKDLKKITKDSQLLAQTVDSLVKKSEIIHAAQNIDEVIVDDEEEDDDSFWDASYNVTSDYDDTSEIYEGIYTPEIYDASALAKMQDAAFILRIKTDMFTPLTDYTSDIRGEFVNILAKDWVVLTKDNIKNEYLKFISSIPDEDIQKYRKKEVREDNNSHTRGELYTLPDLVSHINISVRFKQRSNFDD